MGQANSIKLISFYSSLLLSVYILFNMEALAIEAQSKKEGEIALRPKVQYNAKDYKDPFKAPVVENPDMDGKKEVVPEAPVKAGVPPVFTVQGIIYGGNFPQAIINNKVVKIGDTLNGCRIISIDKDNVGFFFEGTQYSLASPASVIRKGKGDDTIKVK